MIKSKPKQTAFRNKESIRCHWHKEVKASDLANCLGSFIRYTLGQCRRAKKASERKMEEREKRRACTHLYKYRSLPTTLPTSKWKMLKCQNPLCRRVSHAIYMYTAISRKVVGKKSTRQSQKALWVVWVLRYSKKFERIGTEGHGNVFSSANGKQ